MKILILNIGKELLDGEIRNSNGEFIMRKISERGVDVSYQMIIEDNKQDILDCLDYFYNKVDLTIITGGLGMTDDDITQSTVEEFIVNQGGDTEIKKLYNNDFGVAKGIKFIHKNKKYILMPGPPRELKPMFSRYILDDICVYKDIYVYNKVYKIGLLSEGECFDIIKKQGMNTLNEVTTYIDSENSTYIKLNIKEKDKLKALTKFNNLDKQIKKIMYPFIYSTNNISREENIMQKLKEKQLTISTAESFTGGRIVSSLISIPGASESIEESYIVYSNKQKTNLLGVKKSTLEKYTVVSSQVCKEMLDGLKNLSDTDIQISTTGYAGPGGEDVGKVYIGIQYKGVKYIFDRKLIGNRDMIINKGKNAAIDYLNIILDGNYNMIRELKLKY